MVTPLIKKGTESVSIHLNKWLLQFSANRYTEFVEHVVCLLASVLSEKSRSATKTSGVNSIKNKSSGLQREHERVLSGLRPTVFIPTWGVRSSYLQNVRNSVSLLWFSFILYFWNSSCYTSKVSFRRISEVQWDFIHWWWHRDSS